MHEIIEHKPEQEKKRGQGFKRALIVIALVAVLGGGTLGTGIGMGMAAVKYLLPASAYVTENADNTEREAVYVFYPEDTNIETRNISVPVNYIFGNFSGAVKTVKDSVVSINVTAMVTSGFGRQREAQGSGSGFIFAEDENAVYIATNNHVIERVDSVSISLDDNQNVPAKIIGRDAVSDLAVLSVQKSELDDLGIPYSVAVFGDSEQMEMGDPVLAMGNALGEGQTATSGIISAINRQITVEGKTLDVIQTDAAINRGNSGGPLVNIRGEVIGINTAKMQASGVEGMGYSLPINEARKILENLRAEGSAQKPYLGISVIHIHEELKELYNFPSVGAWVQAIYPGGPADVAGLKAMDLILSFGGVEIIDNDSLVNAVNESRVGDEVVLKIYRNGVNMELIITIGNANDNL